MKKFYLIGLRYGVLLALLLALALGGSSRELTTTILDSRLDHSGLGGSIAVAQKTELGDLLQDRIDRGLIEATIEDSFIAPRSIGEIILFKDRHRTSLIQQQTARSLINLRDIIDFIAVEGASKPLNLSLYTNLRKIDEVEGFLPDLAWGWLVNNCVQPGEYYALALEEEPVLRPVEDAAAYEAHKECLLRARTLEECEDKLNNRDKAIAQNIAAILEEPGQDIGVLVVGSGHISDDSITRALRELNISYYVLSPNAFDRCIGYPVPEECGEYEGDYWAVCPYIAEHQTPLNQLLEWLSGAVLNNGA